MNNSELLSIRGLRTVFDSFAGPRIAVRDVSLNIEAAKMTAIVGESGCGKTVLALSLLGLVPHPGRISKGEILFQGEDLREMSKEQLRSIRGNSIAMIFQEPMTSLNPVLRIGEQLIEPLVLHKKMKRKEAWSVAEKLLSQVGIAGAESRMRAFPHQLSGGMRQRVMIAMALTCKPALIIADEPTTALDVTIQKQILELLLELIESEGMAVMLITHNLAVVAKTAKRVAVMYAGEIVEVQNTIELFSNPLHPYTRALLDCLPSLANPDKPLYNIKGSVPSPAENILGCQFHPRCPIALPRCKTKAPPLYCASSECLVRCWEAPEHFRSKTS